jgi:hypothetical protein
MQAVLFTAADEERWDALVARCALGTMLHTRRFLSYHGDRFQDRSVLFQDESGRLCGVLPAAVHPEDPVVVVSHPGITYGGLLLAPEVSGLRAFECLQAARVLFADLGFRHLDYRSVPCHLHRGIDQVDLYALWKMGARLRRRDLWNVIDLRQPGALAASRHRRLPRPPAGGVTVAQESSAGAYDEFHALLTLSLQRGHSTRPVHTAAEMQLLQQRFPDQIGLWLARDSAGALLAGVWAFQLGGVRHGQYGASTDTGRRHAAQDLILRRLIAQGVERGDSYFSFGTSTEDQGRILNEGLFGYKDKFGAGAVVHDFYELDLRPAGGA